MTTSVLKKFDFFVRKQDDETTRTRFGGLLTLCLPGIVVGFISYNILNLLSQAPAVQWEFRPGQAEVFSFTLRCMAENCWYSQSYSGTNSRACVSRLRAAESSDNSDTENQCTSIGFNATRTVDFCYTTDPNDGPTVLWRREQECPSSQLPEAGEPTLCPSGVEINLQQYALNSQNQFVAQSSWLQLFYGVHVLQYWEQTFGAETHRQFSAIQVSSETTIDSSNVCCAQDATDVMADPRGIQQTCRSGDSLGGANDHFEVTQTNTGFEATFVPGDFYQIKLRTFPTFEKTTYSQDIQVLLNVVNTAGSYYTVTLWVCSLVVLFYRSFWTSHFLKSANSLGGLNEKGKTDEGGRQTADTEAPAVLSVKVSSLLDRSGNDTDYADTESTSIRQPHYAV